MPEFSLNCLDCTTNLLSNLSDANSNWNLQRGNSAHNVSNEGTLSFFKNVVNSSCNTLNLELLKTFLIGLLGGGVVGIKLFALLLKTDRRSFGLNFPFVFRTEKPDRKVFGLVGMLSLGIVFFQLFCSCRSYGSRYTATFSFSER